jgi:hypothetical protein
MRGKRAMKGRDVMLPLFFNGKRMSEIIEYRGFEIWTELHGDRDAADAEFFCSVFFRELPNGEVESFLAGPPSATSAQAYKIAFRQGKSTIDQIVGTPQA